MYTSGHVDILRAALAEFGSDYFEDKEDWKVLKAALAYPDFPCGKIAIEGDQVVEHMQQCGVARLVASMFFNKMSLGYQSRRGVRAHLLQAGAREEILFLARIRVAHRDGLVFPGARPA